MPPKDLAWTVGFILAASLTGIFLEAYGIDGLGRVVIAVIVGIGGGWTLNHFARRSDETRR